MRLSIELFIRPIVLSFPGSLQFGFWKYYYLFNSISYISLISLFHLALWAFSLGIVCIHIFLILFGYSYHHSELLVWDFIQVVLIQIIITELVIFGEDIFPCFFYIFIIAWWHIHLKLLYWLNLFLKKIQVTFLFSVEVFAMFRILLICSRSEVSFSDMTSVQGYILDLLWERATMGTTSCYSRVTIPLLVCVVSLSPQATLTCAGSGSTPSVVSPQLFSVCVPGCLRLVQLWPLICLHNFCQVLCDLRTGVSHIGSALVSSLGPLPPQVV